MAEKKVDNVKINVGFSEEQELKELKSGERLSVLMGKLAKGVKGLITHLADNVRHVTAAERTAWNGKAAGSHTHGAATSTANGFMSAADKTKLDGIAEGANKYTHPTTAGNKHIPAGGSSGQILRWSSDGTAEWGADNNTTYSNMTAATASAAGKAGLVPAPAAGAQTKYLRGDGTWQTPPDTNTTYAAATQSANGLMTAADKKKLDGIAEGAQVNTDVKVTQTNTTTAADYRIILSANANDTTETTTARKSANFLANPSTGEFYAAGGYRRIDITGKTLDINTLNLSSGSPNIAHYINKTDGGAANITNIPVAGKPFLLDVEAIRWASTSDYITFQTFRSAQYPANEYFRICNKGTWGAWTTRVFTDTKYSNMSGASASEAGKAGLVPAPAAGAQAKYLRGDGTWQTPPDTNTTYSAATQSANGLMSAVDKKKLDNLETSFEFVISNSKTGTTDYAFLTTYSGTAYINLICNSKVCASIPLTVTKGIATICLPDRLSIIT